MVLAGFVVMQTSADPVSNPLDKMVEFSVSAQRTDKALIEFAEQADITLIFPFEDASNVMAKALVGNYKVIDGLTAMLAGTSLAMSIDDGLVSVNLVNKDRERMIKKSFFKRMISAITMGFLAVGASAETAAQNSDTGSVLELEEVLVTALKRSSTVQDTPVAISALGSVELEDRGISNMSDLKFAVPSMNFTTLLGQQSITIRGIGQFNGQPGVSVSTDGIYQPRATSAQLGEMDIERIEVLRGPQGTLYGRNSNGGVVNLITRAATQETSGFFKLGYTDYDEIKIEGAYGGAITDSTSARLAFSKIDQGEGYVECLTSGCDDQLKTDRRAFRLKISSDLSEDLTADFLIAQTTLQGSADSYLWLSDNRELATLSGIPQVAGEAISLEPNKIYNSVNPINDNSDSEREYDVYGVTLNWDTSLGTLKSITAIQDFYDDFRIDRDGTEALVFDTYDISNTETFSQELNFNIQTDSIDIIVGVFYMDSKSDRDTHFDIALPIFGLGAPSNLDFRHVKNDTETTAYFVDATFDLNDVTSMSVGVRRTTDETESRQDNSLSILIPEPFVIAQTCDRDVSEEWSSTTTRAVIHHDLTDSSNVYASYSEGFKAGGFATYECEDPYNPEEIVSFEVGFKGAIGASTTLNAALFHYEYNDFQVSQVIGLSSVTRNAGDASVNGFELETQSNFTDNLSLTSALTYLDSTYGKFENVNGLQPELGVQQLEGNTLNNAPKTSVNLGLNYLTGLSNGSTVSFRVNAAYRSKTYFSEFNDFPQNSYIVADLNIIWEGADDKFKGRFFVKNITDEEYISGYLASATNGGRFGQWGAPRVVGIELQRNF